MLNLKNTLDGYLKNVEVIGNTVQDENNLADIRSVGDKVEGQELYEIPVVSVGKNLWIDSYTSEKSFGISGTPNSGYYTQDIKLKPNTNYTISISKCTIPSKGYYRVGIGNSASSVGGPQFPSFALTTNNTGGSDVVVVDKKATTTTLEDGILRLTVWNGGYNNTGVRWLFDKIEGIQLEEGTQATPYEPYQEQKLEILSPVQLEKVGDVADRIICKDGVWGVEKNVIDKLFNGSENWVLSGWAPQENTIAFKLQNTTNTNLGICDKFILNRNNSTIDTEAFNVDSVWNEISVRINKSKLSTQDVTGFKKWLSDNTVLIMYSDNTSTFTPLPHDQQVKLRTFAGQTNIAFLTEIPGQIKAQVPKSLGATVNTHTEQIADLHNSLERVKKLEETTVSTVETESNFTTVDATSNGYFEDVKLEGRTLVNLFDISTDVYPTEVLTVESKKNRIMSIGKDEYASSSLTVNGEVIECGNDDVAYRGVKLLIDSHANKVFTLIIYKSGVSIYKHNDLLHLNDGLNVLRIQTDSNGKYFKTIETIVAGKFTLSNIMLLEGDHTSNPPEYFEGLMSVGQDVEEVNVESVNENLFDGEVILNAKFENNGSITQGDSAKGCVIGKNFIKVDSNFRYNLTSNKNFRSHLVCEYDKYKNFICRKDSVNTNSLSQNCEYVKIYCYTNDTSLDLTNLQIMFTKGTTPKPYTPHQSNKKPLLYYNPTTETWERPVLREWDTIEKHSDGKYYYHKRSGEVVLNGSESWVSDSTAIHTAVDRYLVPFPKAQGLSRLLCDNFTVLDTTNINVEGVLIGSDKSIYCNISKAKLSTQDVAGFKAWLKANPTTVVYQLAQEEVYECSNIDLMTYSGETNYIINSGAISPKSLLKVHNNISNVVKILQEKVSLLENTFIAGLKSVLSGDMYSLATILYPEDFEQNDNIEQDIMVIPE